MDSVVNWFVNARCNLTCAYCFREKELIEKDTPEMLKLVNALSTNGVQRVTIGGGEPLLRKDLEDILKALKTKGIFVSLHTNGTLLPERLDRLAGLVDILSLPLDSIYEGQNKIMRGIPYVDLIQQIIESTKDRFTLAFKTTATQINAKSLHKIYAKINQIPFAYWKIYQFRPLNDAKSEDALFHLPNDEFAEIKQKLERYQDRRIHPITRKEGHQPYVFLDNEGNISTVHPFEERNINVGNLYTHDLSTLGKLIDNWYSSATQIPTLSDASFSWQGRDQWRTRVEGPIDHSQIPLDLKKLPVDLTGLLDLAKPGTLKIRIISSNDPNDPRLDYYADD